MKWLPLLSVSSALIGIGTVSFSQPVWAKAAPSTISTMVVADATQTTGETISDTSQFALWDTVDSAKSIPITTEESSSLTLAAGRDAASGHLYIALHNDSDMGKTIRLALHLPSGLWRMDAALSLPGEEQSRRWRMESILQTTAGDNGKSFPIPAGGTMVLRLTETVAAARKALAAARVCENEGGKTYAGATVASNFKRIGAILDNLSAQVAAGKRDKIAIQAHNALLFTAQAMAMTANGRDAGANDQEPVFDALTEGLSEISLAALKGTPSAHDTTLPDGRKMLEVSFTNGSSHTLPLVALGLSTTQDAQKVFRNVPVGGRVTALFPIPPDSTVEPTGTVQFHLGGSSLRFAGTAVVPAKP